MIRHCEHAVARVNERLAGQKRQQRALQQEIEALLVQAAEIDDLILNGQFNRRVVDRAELFGLQQRQAVLRQQRYLLDFERGRLLEKMTALEEMQRESSAEILQLQRKHRKFEHWSSVQKRQHMLTRLQREELENEERVVWKKPAG